MNTSIIVVYHFVFLLQKTGDVVAVKMFNHMSYMRPQDVQQREFEVLLKLKHRNIIYLHGIEEDVSTTTFMPWSHLVKLSCTSHETQFLRKRAGRIPCNNHIDPVRYHVPINVATIVLCAPPPPPEGGGGTSMYAYWVCAVRETPIFSPEFPFRSISFHFHNLPKNLFRSITILHFLPDFHVPETIIFKISLISTRSWRILPFRRPSFSKFL